MNGLFLLYTIAFISVCVQAIDKIITGEQGKQCHASNFCERNLTLNYNQRRRNSRKFDLTDEPNGKNIPGIWTILRPNRNYRGGRRDFTLVIKAVKQGKTFEIRKLCIDVRGVKRVDATFFKKSGDDHKDAKHVECSNSKGTQVCLKEANTEHHLVTSIKLVFIHDCKQVVLANLIFMACGDLSAVGAKNTKPNAKTTMLTIEKPKREECFDQFHFNYGNRDLEKFSFTDHRPGSLEERALDGSGNIYSGETGKKVTFTFSYSRSRDHEKFVWWRVCFLIQNVKSVTYRLEGEVDSLVETITVCNPSNYLWKCYNPWNRFVESVSGKIIIEPSDRKAMIKVSTMSITICLDNEFKGEIIRIGKAFKKCRDTEKTDICEDIVRVQRADLKDFKSPFDLSDEEKEHNTSAAWQALSDKSEGYVVAAGKEISLTYKLHTPCSSHPDGLFQARKIQFWGQNMGEVYVKFCDIHHPLQTKPLYCSSSQKTFANFKDPGRGITVEPTVPTGSDQLFIINNWHPVTAVNIRVIPKNDKKPTKMYWFNIFACCSERHIKRDEKEVDDAIGKEQDKPRVTGNQCQHHHRMVHKRHSQHEEGLFQFDDRDNERDETRALVGSKQIYTGAPGKNIYFYISFADNKNFEWWEVCGKYLNIQKITYVMQTSRVTFIQSTTICGIDAPQRKCYSPRDQGMIVSRGAVKFEVVPGRVGEIRDFEVQACRDHFHYEYSFHIDPCDYKSLMMHTPRNQDISIYGVKDSDGSLSQTELYHFTDNTGNDGDNTWFTLEPKHHLVSAIWTNQTYIELKWDIKLRRVQFDVTITAGNKAHTKFILLDLKNLAKLNIDSSAFNVTTEDNTPSKECNRIPFKVVQCGHKVEKLVVNAKVDGKRTFEMPARHLTKKSKYEFVLPKTQFEQKTNIIEKQCSRASQTKITECAKHAVFNRIQHHFLCDSMKNIISQYHTPRVRDVSRIWQACLYTYKTLSWVCSVMAERTRSDVGFHFATSCPKHAVQKVNLYNNFIDKSAVDIEATGLDLDNRMITTNPPNIMINLNGSIPDLIGTNSNEFKIIGITTVPEEIPQLYPYNYTVCINYLCPTGNTGEQMFLLGKSAGRDATYATCDNLSQMKPCCVDMEPRDDKNAQDEVTIVYLSDSGADPERIQKEELIPTVP